MVRPAVRLRHAGQPAAMLLLFAALSSPAAARYESLRWMRTLTPTGAVTSAFGAFGLDDELFAQAGPSHEYLRVVDEAGSPVPMVVRARHEMQTVLREFDVAMEDVATEINRDGQWFIMRRPDGNPVPTALDIITPQIDFDKIVDVNGSNDRAAWALLATEKPVFDYSHLIGLRNFRVDFEAVPFKYYRLLIRDCLLPSQSPLTWLWRDLHGGGSISPGERKRFSCGELPVERLAFRAETQVEEMQGVLRNYPMSNVSIARDRTTGNTIVTTSSGWHPLASLRLVTDTPFYRRSFLVEGSLVEKPRGHDWHELATGVVSRATATRLELDKSVIHLPRTCRFAAYRITVYNRGAEPLLIRDVTAEGEVHEVVFACNPGATYRVLFGTAGAPPPADSAKALKDTGGENVADFVLGPIVANPVYEARKNALRHKWRSVFAAMVMIGLAAVAIAARKRWIGVAPSKR